MSKTKIEWTDRVWNPVTGCTKVSPGCANCYAERMAKRLRGRCGYPQDDPFKVTYHHHRLIEPLKWRKPSKVFVCSMSDLFHNNVDFEILDQIFAVINRSPQHTFLILTKRPKRMKEYFFDRPGWHIKNLWLGVSAENQQTADERLPILLQIPAAVRFVSCEPLLGPVDLKLQTSDCQLPTLNWVITGGESGPGARPMHPDWARSLRDQCQAANVPFFFKQWGEWQPQKASIPAKVEYWFADLQMMAKVGKKAAGRLLDGKEYNEFPGLKSNV